MLLFSFCGGILFDLGSVWTGAWTWARDQEPGLDNFNWDDIMF